MCKVWVTEIPKKHRSINKIFCGLELNDKFMLFCPFIRSSLWEFYNKPCKCSKMTVEKKSSVIKKQNYCCFLFNHLIVFILGQTVSGSGLVMSIFYERITYYSSQKVNKHMYIQLFIATLYNTHGKLWQMLFSLNELLYQTHDLLMNCFF